MMSMFGGLQIVSLGSEEGEISIAAAGKNGIKMTQKVPKGIKRVFLFGNIMIGTGLARNFQLFSSNEKSNKRYPVSPLDNSIKGLEGNQILNEDFVLEADVVAAADNGLLVWSLSYVDVIDPVRRG